MSGLFAGTPLERPVTCEVCGQVLDECRCPRDAEGNVLLPRHQTAILRREKRRKGKVVTTITGLDPVASDLPAILKQLKTACATGGTLAGDHSDTIELQGDHRDRAAALLQELDFKTKIAGG